MNKRGIWLAIVVGLQALWLVGMAVSKEANLRGATAANTILLETLPVDPRDWLRGDFVILNYKISSAPTASLSGGPSTMLNGRDVWVTLEKRGKFHELAAVSLSPVETPRGQIVVRGTLESQAFAPSQTIAINYGIEKYFVREGTGNPRGKVTVQCLVDREGRLQIKEVFVNDVPYAQAMQTTR